MVAGAVCSVIEMGCFSPEFLYTVHHHGEVFATAFFTVATDTLFSYRFAGTYFKKVGQFGGRIHGVGLTDLLDPVSHIKSCAGKLHGSLGFRESVLTEFVGCSADFHFHLGLDGDHIAHFTGSQFSAADGSQSITMLGHAPAENQGVSCRHQSISSVLRISH